MARLLSEGVEMLAAQAAADHSAHLRLSARAIAWRGGALPLLGMGWPPRAFQAPCNTTMRSAR